MVRLPFLEKDRLARFVVSLFLCMGLLLPLMMALGAGHALGTAVAVALAVLAVCVVLGSFKRGRVFVGAAALVFAVVQFALPGMGVLGMAYEAVKAIALYFSGVTAAAPVFAQHVAVLLALACAGIGYLFSSRTAGFLPAAIVSSLVLFVLWSAGCAQYLWYALPALAAVLLLIAQTSHEKVNLFEVMPLAALVVVVAMLILPVGQTVVRPLYDAAMDLKQAISDYLFFTEPRNVFTLGNYGYYPMGSGKLGGEVQPADYPVMTVKTDRRVLLRGVTKDEYTGRSWRDTSSGKRYLYVSPRWARLRTSVFQQDMPPAAVAQNALLDTAAISVQMQNTAASTVPAPVFLRDFTGYSDLVAYFNDASELFVTRDLQRDDRYTVQAPVLEGGGTQLGALIAAAPQGSDPYYSDIYHAYTQLPDHMEPTVYNDVAAIVSGYGEPYDKACAIMRHLKRYYRYTLSPQTPPENQDFVTYFLYVGKEGYCTYYASAMTVMCRMAGLPARYVEGFVAEPGADGFAYVTGEQAHAWTEVYFEGFGWVPFDATPTRQNEDDETPPEEQTPPEPTPTPTPEPPPESDDDTPTPTPEPDPETPNDPEASADDPSDRPPFPWWLLAVLAAAAGVGARMALRMPVRVADRQKTERDRIFVYGSAANTLLGLCRLKPAPGETPMLFARRVDRAKVMPAPVAPLWRMMALSRYSRMEPGAQQTARAKEAFLRLWYPQKPLTKLRFMLKAAFGRRCYDSLDTQMKADAPKQDVDLVQRIAQKNGAPKGSKSRKRIKAAKKHQAARRRPAPQQAKAPDEPQREQPLRDEWPREERPTEPPRRAPQQADAPDATPPREPQREPAPPQSPVTDGTERPTAPLREPLAQPTADEFEQLVTQAMERMQAQGIQPPEAAPQAPPTRVRSTMPRRSAAPVVSDTPNATNAPAVPTTPTPSDATPQPPRRRSRVNRQGQGQG